MNIPPPESERNETQVPAIDRVQRPFSLESFKRQSSSNRSDRPLSSPSTRGPPPPSHARRRPQAVNQNIAKINNDASRSIRAAQTILDPAAIIKELIENALDARATRIDVRVRGKGALDTITISDNGHGISATDYESLCLPSTTSKIFYFGDLETLSTFGFRGEALSAICAISKSTSVTTRTGHDAVATALTYSKDGSLVSQNAVARPVGTTVQIENVFHTLPVRQKDAIKNHTREVSRCVAAVQALALISVNTRIELKVGGEVKVANLPAMKEQEVIPSSLGKVCLSALRHNAKSVLGARISRALIEISTDKACVVKVPPAVRATMRCEGKIPSENSPDAMASYGCHGLISKASLDADGTGGRAKSSYQYTFVNRRPVDFPHLTRTIKELYRRATGLNAAAPVIILNLVLPAWSCDVNLAPDKRVICVHEEEKLIAGIVSLLEEIWIPTKTATIPVKKDSKLTYMIQPSQAGDDEKKVSSQATADVQMLDIPDEPNLIDCTDILPASHDAAGVSRPEGDGSIAEHMENEERSSLSPGQARNNSNSAERTFRNSDVCRAIEPDPSDGEPSATPPDAQLLSFSPVQMREEQSRSVTAGQNPSYQQRLRESLINAPTRNCTTRNVSSFIARRKLESIVPAKRPRSAKFTWPETKEPLENEEHRAERVQSEEHDMEGKKTGTAKLQTDTIFDEPRPEIEASMSVATLDVDWDRICAEMSEESDSSWEREENGQESDGHVYKNATVRDIENEIVNEAHHQAAENEMCRLFHQEWFNDLEILGQFNRGFIITRLRNDLFIIDQHASDEKYNFEDLQRNTVISKQRLVQPLGLEFSAQDEVLVAQHLSAFRAGGFDIEYREQNLPTRRLFLKAQPISKHTIFVQDDLRDIVDMLKSNVVQSSSMNIKVLRPPRIRAMFASRACRKSIMIGTALQKPQMDKIVRNLATLDHPWTCPHGRPTMRHLCSLPT